MRLRIFALASLLCVSISSYARCDIASLYFNIPHATFQLGDQYGTLEIYLRSDPTVNFLGSLEGELAFSPPVTIYAADKGEVAGTGMLGNAERDAGVTGWTSGLGGAQFQYFTTLNDRVVVDGTEQLFATLNIDLSTAQVGDYTIRFNKVVGTNDDPNAPGNIEAVIMAPDAPTSFSFTVVPEPGTLTLGLLGSLGLLGLTYYRRRRG